MSISEKLRRRYELALMANYGTPPLAISRGDGCTVWDMDGHAYLDLLGGIATSSLGHAHPALVNAVSEQIAKLGHISNFYLHEPEILLAERLLHVLKADGRVFFANSGTEANEAALKLVLRQAVGGRRHLVAAARSFHGRSLGSLSLTGNHAIREPFGPFGTEVMFVPYGDADALREAVTADCAGVFLEPVQGEAGVIEPPSGYLRLARELCDETGAVLVFDEVQSGIGRTGAWFAHQLSDVRPDVLTLAKGLGGGMPIGACIGLGHFGSVLEKGMHGSTFGGNPVCCAAGLAVLDTISRDGLLEHVTAVGGELRRDLAQLADPRIKLVRGVGQWTALVLTGTFAGSVEAAAREAGFLVNAVQPEVIRLTPPLILTKAEGRSFVDALPGILAATAAGEA